MKIADIPQLPRANYSVHTGWKYLEETLKNFDDRTVKGWRGLNLNPPFQRDHVWTEAQQIAYVEFQLEGGESGTDIYFNHPNWGRSYEGEMVLVDGKQRLEAVRKFLQGELKAFGLKLDEFEDSLRSMHPHFTIHVANLENKNDLLRWYLKLNNGTPHTQAELDKVRRMIDD